MHDAHVAVCRAALAEFDLARILLVPAHTPPHKLSSNRVDGEHRLAMLRLAIEQEPSLAVDERELRSGTVQYSADTLAAIAAAEPGCELFFLLGEDSFDALPSWKDPQRLAASCTFIVAPRPGGSGRRSDEFLGATVLWLSEHWSGLSSSEVRATLAAEALSTVSGLNSQVAAYIERHQLYRGSR